MKIVATTLTLLIMIILAVGKMIMLVMSMSVALKVIIIKVHHIASLESIITSFFSVTVSIFLESARACY